MKIIENNPYRQLGVYTNSPIRARVANYNKLQAFLKVGKQVDFPLDLNHYLPPIHRTSETIAQADAGLTLPKEQLKYAQFWFIKATPLDDIAFNHLQAGNMDAAIDIWKKRDCVPSLQNRIVCALLEKDYETALNCAEQFYTQYVPDFVAMILENGNGGTNLTLAFDFIDILCEEVGANIILPYITNDSWKEHVSTTQVKPLIASIEAAIEVAKSSRGKGSSARYQAGIKLMNDTKVYLSQLNKLLSTADLQYQMIADKLSQEILQCGIDYFNGTEEDNAPQKAGTLQNYALSIAVGKLVKDRCKENVDILNNISEEYIVRKELAQLTNYIKELRNEHSTQSHIFLGLFGRNISDIQQIVNKAIPLLDTMSTKLGNANNLYINISSAVASAAINALVEVVNLWQKLSIGEDDKLRSVISDAVVLMNIIGTMTMDARTKNYFNGNKSTLENINNKLNPSGGCYIATMVYGDYNHPQVLVLRSFRDRFLATRNWGKILIRIYYKYSPRLVERLKNHKTINHTIKIVLDYFVTKLKKHNY